MTWDMTRCSCMASSPRWTDAVVVCCLLKLLVACFERLDGQFVEPAAVGAAQQHEILKYIHLTKRQRSLMRGHASLEKLHPGRLDS